MLDERNYTTDTEIYFSSIGITKASDYWIIKYIVPSITLTSVSSKNSGFACYGTIYGSSSSSLCGTDSLSVSIGQTSSYASLKGYSLRLSGGGQSSIIFSRSSNGYAGLGSSYFGIKSLYCTFTATMQVYAKKI